MGPRKRFRNLQAWLGGSRPSFGPDLIFKSGPKHQKWSEMGPESTVWPETWSRSMPGPFRSLWDGSNPLQGAVPGLVLEVQVGSTMSVWAQITENGPNRVQNRPFGLKLDPNAIMTPEGCPERFRPVLRPKIRQNIAKTPDQPPQAAGTC